MYAGIWPVPALLAAALLSAPVARSQGLLQHIEQVLSHPAAQSWLQRPDEGLRIQRQCADRAATGPREPLCDLVLNFQRLAGMPAELRWVMGNPRSAASLRELCLAVQGGPVQQSHLCAELYKADLGFRQQADQRRADQAESLRDKP